VGFARYWDVGTVTTPKGGLRDTSNNGFTLHFH
jgi:hypothetical protein